MIGPVNRPAAGAMPISTSIDHYTGLARSLAKTGGKIPAAKLLLFYAKRIWEYPANRATSEKLLETAREINRCLVEGEKILKDIPGSQPIFTKLRRELVVYLIGQAEEMLQRGTIDRIFLFEVEAIARTEPGHPNFAPLLKEIKVLLASRQSNPPRPGKITQLMELPPSPEEPPIDSLVKIVTSPSPAPPRPSDPSDLWEDEMPPISPPRERFQKI